MMGQKRPLGQSSLVLSIIALLLVGGVLLVQRWGGVADYAIVFFVVAAFPFFLALLGFIMGSTALFAREPQRLTAVTGLTLSLLTLCFTLYTLSTILPK